MRTTTKIRFTEPQIALVMRAHPDCNLHHLTELSFVFDETGTIVDCTGTIKHGGNTITIMPAAGSRACTRRHVANSQLDRPALRFCNSQMARGSPSVLLNVVMLATNRPTRPTGIGMLEISEAGSAWPLPLRTGA